MKRSWIFYAFLACSMLWLAPSAEAATAAGKTNTTYTVQLVDDFTPQQVREILRKTRRATGIPMWRLVRRYLNGRLLMEQLVDGLVKVTILRRSGDPIVVLIETSF